MAQVESNFYSVFERQLGAHAGHELLVTGDDVAWSFRDVEALTAQMASALDALGLEPGDRVSVQVEKSPENLCLYLACLRGGFVFHPLNTAYTYSEVEYFLLDAEPGLVVCDAASHLAVRKIAELANVPHVLTLNADGRGSLRELADSAPIDFSTVARAPDDLAALLYSSGTTGRPKGVMLSHDNLASNTETLVDAWGFTDGDRLLHALPIYHVHGLFVAIGCALASGASMRWLPSFDAKEVVERLPECTVMMGVPTYYTRLLAEPSFTRDAVRNMRLFVSGSAPLRPETFAAFEERTGHRILERYGMTETNMNTSNPLHGERRPGTVGPPLAGVEARVTDDSGESLGADETGNLEVRGPNVFRGYWKLPEKTAEDFTADGFFRTGDKARISADGYVSIVGRAKDVVITGGLNVYPKEVEIVLDRQPGIAESAVIGVPHPDLGECVVAVVVPEQGADPAEDAIIAACREELAGYKLPKRIVAIDALPRNAMAKVQKNRLRDEYRDLFEQSST